MDYEIYCFHFSWSIIPLLIFFQLHKNRKFTLSSYAKKIRGWWGRKLALLPVIVCGPSREDDSHEPAVWLFSVAKNRHSERKVLGFKFWLCHLVWPSISYFTFISKLQFANLGCWFFMRFKGNNIEKETLVQMISIDRSCKHLQSSSFIEIFCSLSW